MGMKTKYDILWYRPAPNARWKCKIDILVPGRISITNLSDDEIRRVQGDEPNKNLPLVPFMILILLKLRGWADHMDDHQRYMREKGTGR